MKTKYYWLLLLSWFVLPAQAELETRYWQGLLVIYLLPPP